MEGRSLSEVINEVKNDYKWAGSETIVVGYQKMGKARTHNFWIEQKLFPNSERDQLGFKSHDKSERNTQVCELQKSWGEKEESIQFWLNLCNF